MIKEKRLDTDMDFKKSETYKNLEKAYDGELLAGTKYRIYSRIANKDGFRQIGNIFEETAKMNRSMRRFGFV